MINFKKEELRQFVDTICKGPPRSPRRERYETLLFRNGQATLEYIESFRAGMVIAHEQGLIAPSEIEKIQQWINLNVDKATTPKTSVSALEESVSQMRRPLRC